MHLNLFKGRYLTSNRLDVIQKQIKQNIINRTDVYEACLPYLNIVKHFKLMNFTIF